MLLVNSLPNILVVGYNTKSKFVEFLKLFKIWLNRLFLSSLDSPTTLKEMYFFTLGYIKEICLMLKIVIKVLPFVRFSKTNVSFKSAIRRS